MGQKIHPHGLRLGIIKTWDAKWYAGKDFAANLHEDLKIRKFIKTKAFSAGVSKLVIERASNRVKVIIHTAKPGMIIGRGGAGIEDMKKSLKQLTGKQIDINIADKITIRKIIHLIIFLFKKFSCLHVIDFKTLPKFFNSLNDSLTSISPSKYPLC